ncbi:MMPL family transporter, partial [Nocardia puris]|nr:MMPL family transporter [Nocardia puris]
LKTAMPSITVVPAEAPVRQGYELIQQQFGPGAPGMLSIITPTADAAATATIARASDGIVMLTPPQPAADGADLVMMQAMPAVDPSAPQMAQILDRLRADLPENAVVGGAA